MLQKAKFNVNKMAVVAYGHINCIYLSIKYIKKAFYFLTFRSICHSFMNVLLSQSSKICIWTYEWMNNVNKYWKFKRISRNHQRYTILKTILKIMNDNTIGRLTFICIEWVHYVLQSSELVVIFQNSGPCFHYII